MTYEYRCKAPGCHHQWEAEQRITDAPLQNCPSCGLATAQRLISKGTFVLSGPGWFKTGGY